LNNPHRIRRLVLQGLCCVDSQGSSAWQSIEEFLRDSRETTMLIEKSLRTLRSAFDMRPQSDEMLLRNAGQWSLARLALIDRNILRLAVYELLATDVPKKVVISEALRLANEFSTAESPRFINGVIEAIMHDIDAHKKDSSDHGDS
jgi:transcription antitermination factor NusB